MDCSKVEREKREKEGEREKKKGGGGGEDKRDEGGVQWAATMKV